MFRQFLHSLLLQGHEDWELVLKDGNVSDPVANDAAVVRLLDLVGPDRVRYAVGPDGGIFAAVNDCLKRAKGDVLNFACSDDLLCPGALEAVNSIFEGDRFGGPRWLYGKTISADITGRKLGVDGAATTYDELLKHNRIGQPATFWNRQLMALAGMFDTRYPCTADYELWLRFWERVEPVFLDQELGVFRHHDDQFSNVNAPRLEREAARVSTRHRLMRDVIRRARNRQAGGLIPETVN